VPLTRCPYCTRPWWVADDRAGGTVRCGDCRRFFTALPDPHPPGGAPELAETAADAPTLLTRPHRCHQCDTPLPGPVGRARDATVCPACRRTTSVYAVLHHCGHCLALLESPARASGMRVTCPACRRDLAVPSGELRPGGDGAAPGERLLFRCPSCHLWLDAPTRLSGQPAACVHCLRVVTVPTGGESPRRRRPDVVREPGDRVAPAPVRRSCRVCGRELSPRAVACGACGLVWRA
jgi:hypothetical protein